jgi:low temperature requirement protein LtrA
MAPGTTRPLHPQRVGPGAPADHPSGHTWCVSPPSPRPSRLGVVLRHGETVSPLELFFDLVFVLAITQCTVLMAGDPTWRGIGRGLLVLGLLWWAWCGYAWLTSVVDPDDGGARLVLFAAMAALLVTSLCAPAAFADLGVTFAVSYGIVRLAHIALFVLASRDDPGLRHSVVGLAASTAIAVTILVAGAFVHGDCDSTIGRVANRNHS